jgi:hypothetical protein
MLWFKFFREGHSWQGNAFRLHKRQACLAVLGTEHDCLDLGHICQSTDLLEGLFPARLIHWPYMHTDFRKSIEIFNSAVGALSRDDETHIIVNACESEIKNLDPP